MKIYLDMDGVICDYHAGLRKTFKAKEPVTPERYAGLDKKAETLSSNWWQELPRTDVAASIIEMVRAHGLLPIVVACPLTGREAHGKTEWLRKNCSLKYKFVTDKLDLDGLLLDDSDNVVERVGASAILIPQPWNSKSHITGITECVAEVERVLVEKLK